MQKMGSVCNHHHLLSQSSSSKKMSHLQDILINNIPPRKLISRTSSTSSDDSSSPAAYDADSDPYSSDQFRMFEFKIRRCTRSRSHDWTDCPFAHPGEKARRRDPRKFNYSGAVCPEFRRSGACSGGDDCEFAHGVFEVWLHPSRYRTEACKDGKNCKRKVCFFAHSPRELRLLPSDSSDLGDVMLMKSPGGAPHCCKHCNCSPRSTLNAPMSPAWGSGGNSQQQVLDEQLAYEEAIGEIMSSLEAMNFKEATGRAGLWVNVANHHGVGVGVGEEQQFLMSPSTPISQNHYVSASSRGYNGNNLSGGGGYGAYDSPGSSRSGYSLDSPISGMTMGGYNSNIQVVEEMQSKGGMGDPDLGWVNDLLM